MPSLERNSQKIVIAGASSLTGVELRTLLEEGRFAAADFRLVDEERVAGTLTEAGGEAAVIQPVEEGTFDRAAFVFFTGSAAFTRANWDAARRGAKTVVDLSGEAAGKEDVETWFRGLPELRGSKRDEGATSFAIPSVGAMAAAGLSLALKRLGLQRLAMTVLVSVSESGRAGVEELEAQTGQLLSLRPVGKALFDTQVAFGVLDRYGAESGQKLEALRSRMQGEIAACTRNDEGQPAIQVIHAPAFYGTAFSAFVEAGPEHTVGALTDALWGAGFAVMPADVPASNLSVAGENVVQIAEPKADPSGLGRWWIWGAGDNVRVPAANAVKLAGELP
jgi:aspartate-semialdehyde dehydrogenase